MQPAVLVHRLEGGVGHLVVALHDVVAARAEFPNLAVGQLFAGLRIDNLALNVRERVTDGLRAQVERVGPSAHRGTRGRFGLPVDRHDAGHVHLVGLGGAFHELGRAAGSGHDARAHVAEVGLLVVLVVEHRDEHRGNAVEGGDLLLRDAVQRRLGAEVGHRAQGRAVRHGRGHRQGHAEAVEHGHVDHEAVCGGQAHAVADALAVVHDVAVREHDALGESCSAGGVLHVADVVGANIGGHALDLLQRHELGALHGLIEGEAAGHLEADGHDVAQEGKLLAVQLLAGFGLGDLGAQLIDDLAVVGIQGALDHDERVRVGLTQQVLGLVDLVGGVHRDEHGADLGGRPEGDVPSRHVGGPDGDLAASLHAHGDKRAGERVDVVSELLVGARVVERRVLKTVLIGEAFDHLVEHLREGQVDELVFLPHVLACAVVVEVERAALAAGVLEALHVVHEVREDDLHVGEVGHPRGIPLQRHVAVVVDGGQRAHYLVDGQRSLADQVEAAVVVGIAHVHVLDVGT